MYAYFADIRKIIFLKDGIRFYFIAEYKICQLIKSAYMWLTPITFGLKNCKFSELVNGELVIE